MILESLVRIVNLPPVYLTTKLAQTSTAAVLERGARIYYH